MVSLILQKNERSSLSWVLKVHRTVSFVCFLDESRTPIFASAIYWPLVHSKSTKANKIGMFFIHHSSLFDLFCFLFFLLFFNLDDYIISANIFSRVRRVVFDFSQPKLLKSRALAKDQILIFRSQKLLKSRTFG